jgi:carbonic anhydrase/acetyltransferase-like protein (isoleucine patch superfamily)
MMQGALAREGLLAIYRLGDDSPVVSATAYIAPNSTVWFGATLRGDNETISIGAESNVQDSAVLHTDPGFPMSIGPRVSIGHQAMMHGCTVGEGTLIGIQSIVLNGATIGKGCLVGAGALITERKVFPDGTLIIGAPAKAVRELSEEERQNLLNVAKNYAERGAYYRSHLLAITD